MPTASRPFRCCILPVAAVLFLASGAVSAARAQHASHADHDPQAMPEEHAEEHVMGHGDQKIVMYDISKARTQDYARETARYDVPAITLRDQDNRPVDLREFLAGDGPLAMQFIFTSCATICPVLSASFAQSEDSIVEAAPDARLISITIDPQYDTPARLKAYAERYNAGEQWHFLTGSLRDIRRVIAAFDAVLKSDNKMYHRPYTYFRGRDGGEWVRTEGLLSRNGMLKEFASALGQPDNAAASGAGGD